MGEKPAVEHVYRTMLMDSGRWDAFAPRDGDILVCTSYKAGTTWTQMICGLLIHQKPDLPAPLAELSPWLDMRLTAIDDVLAAYEAQSHRRFIKTHTPMDGLPYFENVTYLVCGRDPRDVFMSMQHHMSNLDMERFIGLLVERGVDIQPPPPGPADINERFKLWMTTGSYEWEKDGYPYWSHFHHAQTFWSRRHLPNVHFLHYADLKADLEGEMRRVARALGVAVDEALWPGLVKAATFGEMKSNANRTAPDTDHGIWLSNGEFFHTGSNEQWRSALSEANLLLYQDIKRERFEPSFADWLERGAHAAGNPKTVG